MKQAEQIELFEKSPEDRIRELEKALVKFGKHSFYCCWIRDLGRYDRSLGCTCGLGEILEGIKEEI